MANNKIKLTCYTCNSLNILKYHIFIYNLENKLIINKTIKENDVLYFELPCFDIYKIKIIMYDYIPRIIYKTSFYYSKNCNKLSFAFKIPNINTSIKKPITLTITDQNYKDLQIAKGEIHLWQSLM